MKKHDCRKTQYLETYFDNALDGKQHEEIKRHLQTCLVCQESYRILEHMRGALREKAMQVLDRDRMQRFWDELEPRIKTQQTVTIPKVRTLAFYRNMSIVSLATAAVLFLAVRFTFMQNGMVPLQIQRIEAPNASVMVYDLQEGAKKDMTVIWVFEQELNQGSSVS